MNNVTPNAQKNREAPPPGWYLHPADPRRQMWWTGRGWSSYTRLREHRAEVTVVKLLLLWPFYLTYWLLVVPFVFVFSRGRAYR